MRRFAFTADDALAVGEAIGIAWDDVDFTPEDLAAGMDVELEHGTKLDERVNVTDDDVEATAQIAWAHLMEDPDYYVMLDAMEQEFDGERTPELRKEGNVMLNRRIARRVRRAAKIDFTTVDLDDIAEYKMAQDLGRALDNLSRHYVGNSSLLDWSAAQDIDALLDNLDTLTDKAEAVVVRIEDLNRVLQRYRHNNF